MTTKVWDDPAVYDIQLELPNSPLRNLNVYVIATPEQNLIIDTGFNRDECRSALWAGIRELGLDLSRTSLFLTHFHSDHVGLAEEFVPHGCPICMGRIDYQYLDGMKNGTKLSATEALFLEEGFPEDVLALQSKENQGRRFGVSQMFPARLVNDGDVIRLGDVEARCVHTPGHTPGHMALYLPQQQLLFTGDHILFDITPNIAVWTGVPHSLQDYLDSLDKIRALPVKAAFPAHRHGESDVYRRIDALQAHHRDRLEEIFRAVEAHPQSTAYDIAGYITWSARGLGWDRFPPPQKWFAMGETLAHLRWLEDNGRVVRTRQEGAPFRYTTENAR